MKQNKLSLRLFILYFMKCGRISRHLLFYAILALLLSLMIIGENQAGQFWKPLPLRTQAQKDGGMPGGEGMQQVWGISYAPSDPNIAYLVSDTSGVWRGEWKENMGDWNGDGELEGGLFWVSMRGDVENNKGFRASGGTSLVVDPNNPDVVFVSGSRFNNSYTSEVNGIYRTTDGGNSWDLVYKTNYNVTAGEGQYFAFDTRSFNGERHMIVYAGTHGDGLLKSTDGGDSWTVILGLEGKRILDIDFCIKNDIAVLYIATDDISSSSKGLYQVIDDGSDPVILALGNLPDYPRTIAVNKYDSNIIYTAVGTYKVYKSTDGGATFIEKSNGLPNLNQDGGTTIGPNVKEYRNIDISDADPNYLYVFVNAWWGYQPFYSHDGGETWQMAVTSDAGGLSFRDSTWSSRVTATHPTDPNTAIRFFGSVDRVAITRDGGINWSYSSNGYLGARRSTNKTSAHFDPTNPNRKIFFLVDYGPAITEDGGDTWRLPMLPYSGSPAYPLTTPVGAVDPDNPNRIITAKGSWGSQNIVISDNGGSTWTTILNTTGSYKFMIYHPQDSNFIYAGTSASGSWISEDDGTTWTKIDDKSIRAVYPGNGNIAYAFGNCTGINDPVSGCNPQNWQSVLFRSDDKGVNWSPLALFGSGIPGIDDVDIAPDDPDRLYVATTIGFYIFSNNYFTETGKAGGIPEEFFSKELRELSNGVNVNSVTVDPSNSNMVYAGMWSSYGHRRGFIYRSTDKGQTWNDFRLNLDGYSTVWSLAVDPVSRVLHMNTSHGNYVLCTDNDSDGYAVEDGVCGPVDNCPDTYNPDQADSNGNGIGDVCDPVDLSVSISDSPDPVLLGDTITYTVTITNNGLSTATGVTATGTLPTCTTSSLASGATFTCTNMVTASSVGTLNQSMTVGAAEYDPDMTNNTASASTSVLGSCTGGSYNILGKVVKADFKTSIPGVSMTLIRTDVSPGCGNRVTTSSKGIYQFKKLQNGTYQVTPSKTGCSVFNPANRQVTISGGSMSGQNFTGTCP
ncbi:MAG: DUF11 domain-containing protein [Deltaproteobacteria bacterium]|nr:DUF11 domain-containing protein [Deltaproteobacteria bacterium]